MFYGTSEEQYNPMIPRLCSKWRGPADFIAITSL
jgi:hypothetical protein